MKKVKLILSILCVVLLTGCGGSGNTINDDYKASDVAFTCTSTTTDENAKTNMTVGVVFGKGHAEAYSKMEIQYNEMDDEKMLKLLRYIDAFGGANGEDHFNVKGTTKFSGVTNLGTDTVVTRNGKKVTVTYKNVSGNDSNTLTQKDKDDFKKSFEDEGMTCK